MIKRFQQGGSSNIAIGSPKPYTTNLPGINVPSTSFNNAPIEINTTSIFDQMDKMQRLKLDQEKLKFQYEELKYKEGKAYMDFAGDMMKTMQTSVKNNLTGLGGLSSMERYAPIFESYNKRKAEAMEGFMRQFQHRDPNALMGAMKKMMEVETDPEYTNALGQVGLLEEAIKYKLKNPTVTNSKLILNILDFASNPNADFAEFLPSIMDELADNTKNTDIQKTLDGYLDNLIQTTKGTKTETGHIVLPSGMVSKTYGHYITPAEQIENGLTGIFLSSAGYKNYLESQGVNPENIEDVKNFLRPTAQAYHEILNNSFKPITETSGTIQKGIKVNPDGSVDEKPDADASGNKKMTDSEKKQLSRKERIIADFGLKPLGDATVRNLMLDGGEDWYEKVTSYLKSKGINPKGGAATEGSYSKLNIKGLEDLGIPIDPKRTKIIESNGNKFLVTNQETVIKKVDNDWKDSTKILEDAYDSTVRKELGLSGWDFDEYSDEPNKWNTIPADPNTTVYKIESAPQSTTDSVSIPGSAPEIIKEMNKNSIIRNMDDVDKTYVAYFLGSEELQDKFFDEELYPEIEATVTSIKQKHPDKAKKFTENQLAYIVHHQGASGAMYFFDNNFKTKPSKNKNSSQELQTALSKIGDGEVREEIAKVESNSNPFIVYKGGEDSSAAGKYQVLVKTHIDRLKSFIDRNIGWSEEQPQEPSTQQDTTTVVKPTGKFFKAAQDSTRTNPNFNVGQ